MHWNDEVKREIPDAWDVFKLGDVFETSLGGTPATNDEAYWKNGTISLVKFQGDCQLSSSRV